MQYLFGYLETVLLKPVDCPTGSDELFFRSPHPRLCGLDVAYLVEQVERTFYGTFLLPFTHPTFLDVGVHPTPATRMGVYLYPVLADNLILRLNKTNLCHRKST